jgi:hypothetical protein
MAEFKSIEATPENIAKLQQVIRDMDATAQQAEDRILALTRAIGALLLQPDSGALRVHIDELCGLIDTAAFETMNFINSAAEEAGATHIDEAGLARYGRLHEAARQSNHSH